MLLEGSRSASGMGGAPGAPAPWPRDWRGPEGPGLDTTRFGLLAFLGTVSMLFIGFTSALMLRRASADWQPIQAPALLWWNTALLALSSLALERSRRLMARGEASGARRALQAAAGLGALFVAGQLLAWRGLAAQGIYLSSNPASSFFYLLSGVHLAHLAGGLVWLAVVLAQAWRGGSAAPARLSLLALYWHFLGGLWLYLLVVLFAI
jgi:cytochrome c oxidase subunit 3